ncbi:uncharacterized protein LOC110036932 [Phalaenopsis equestris]|uniref:uncharacterized protein LOC110036932 n=1 Tax=Phalaenopsis equestris TaxID=78828 RepID=UPI0009E5E0F1|nr:uncharacterized protein LOC110036932 [Phalaenopsis equestris]
MVFDWGCVSCFSDFNHLNVVNCEPPASPPAIFNTSLSSPPPVASALRADTGSSSAEDSLQWEELIEKGIYKCRFLAFFGVLGSLMGSVLCYLKGCVLVINSFADYIGNGGRVIVMLVEAVGIAHIP